MDIITFKDNPDEFRQICQEQGFEYITTVHHFTKDAVGIYHPVFWGDIASTAHEVPR